MTIQTVTLGKAGQIEVDVTKFTPAVNAYIFQYGLKQMLNDVHAGEKEPAAKLALTQKKLDSLYRGEVAQARVGKSGDPVQREMAAMAESKLVAKLRAIGKKVKDFDKAVWAAVIQKELAANEAGYRAAAEAKLAIKPDVEDADDIMAMLAEAETPAEPAAE